MQIPLTVCAAAAAGPQEIVTFGVPLPQSAAALPSHWCLEDVNAVRVPADVRPLATWPDGGARWLLVDACIDNQLDRQGTLTLIGSDQPLCPAGAALSYAEGAGDLAVDTGAARFSFRVGGAVPFDEVTVLGRNALAPAETRGLLATGPDGGVATATVQRVELEHRGRLRASVRLSGTIRLETRTLEVDVRVDLHAGQADARVRCTIRNPDRAKHPGNFWDLGDPGSMLIRDLSLVFTLAESGPAAAPVSHYSVEPGHTWRSTAATLEIYQDSSGGENWKSFNHRNRQRQVPTVFRGYRVSTAEAEESGLRATPAVCLDAGDVLIGAASPTFWQNFPKALETDQRRLSFRMFPRRWADLHELQGGEQKTHELFITFEPVAAARARLDLVRCPTLLAASPEWTLASGAMDFLAALESEHGALAGQAVDGPDTFEMKREVIDQYGWRNFGEIYGDHEAIGHSAAEPLVSHYNNQYDPVFGFGLQFLRTADLRWWKAMHELAGHVSDIDIYHTRQDKAAYNGGLFWHTYHYGDADLSTHRTYPSRNTGTIAGGGPSADHNYPAGLVLHYYLTGDEASKQAAIGLAQYVLDLEDGRLWPFRYLTHADTGRAHFTPPDYYGPSRSSGNSLSALIDGHLVSGDAKFLSKADQLVLRVIHPDDDQKALRLDEPEYRWFYAMFLQALGKYLHRKVELGQLDDAYAHGRASLLAYARWMADHEYPYLTRPEKLEYPTETWAAQDIRKVDIFCFAAIHSSGAERERFLERAAFFHRTSVETLRAMPTRSLARPVIVLMTSGAMLSWLVGHPDYAEPAPASGRAPRPRTAFVPQRRIAERRALVIVAVSAVAGVAAAAAALFWWFQTSGGV